MASKISSKRLVIFIVVFSYIILSFIPVFAVPTPLPPPMYITNLAWSPDGSQIAVGHGSYSCDKSPDYYSVQILDTVNLQVVQTLEGATCNITAVDWNADSTRMAAASSDNIGIRVWDTQTGHLLTRDEDHGLSIGITSVKWRPSNNQQLAMVSDNGFGTYRGVDIFDVSTGKTKSLTALGGSLIDWSPDGTKLVTARTDDNMIYTVDGTTGGEILTLKGHTDGIAALDWSPNGQKIASSSYDKSVRIWDASSGQSLFAFNTDGVSRLQWSPDSQKLATISDDGVVQVWDTVTQQLLFSLASNVGPIVWSPDGQKLVYGINDIRGQEFKVQIVDVGQILASSTPVPIPTFQPDVPINLIMSIDWSPDGTKIAVGGGIQPCNAYYPDTYAVQVLDAQTLELQQRLYGNECDIYKVKWSPDGTEIAAAGVDTYGTHIWDIATGEIVATQQQLLNGSIDVDWFPDGKKLIVVTVGNEIIMMDVTTGETIGFTRYGGGGIALSPDGTNLLIRARQVTYILDIKTNHVVADLDGHTEGVSSIAWSHDGQQVATGSADKTIRIWDANTFKTLLVLEGHTDLVSGVSWSADDRHLATVSIDGTLRVWDTATGEQVAILQAASRLDAVAWSPDGENIAYGGVEGVVHVIPVRQLLTSVPMPSQPS